MTIGSFETLLLLVRISPEFDFNQYAEQTEIVSRRGVVFFRNQDLNSDEQKILGQKLGELTGKPATSKVNWAHL